ncbi:MAG: sodium:alanine symporter family protein [Tenericutes bacterium]|nr:sodium:alanine symporter family protein [Mycoplasmatota bacterium]
MLDKISAINDYVNNIVWGAPMILLLFGTGIYFSIRLGFFQVTKIKEIYNNTLKNIFKKSSGSGAISSGKTALVSLGAIVGSGNIAGVATAIASGGPGALVWMWIAAFFGMATKFAEITLGQMYRKVTKKDGEVNIKGGPMYYLRDGVKSKFLAGFYAFMAMVSYIVIVAMVDTNTIVLAVQNKFDVASWVIALVLIVIVGFIIFGGIKRLGDSSSYIVPFMGILYIITGVMVLIVNHTQIADAFLLIFKSAFTPQAAAGGFAGATISEIIKYGLSRGMYSNEAGLGSAAIVHSAAKTDSAVKQAFWSPVEIFLDTMLINTITGLVIVISGLWTNGTSGAALAMDAFNNGLPGGLGSYLILISSILFSFTCLTSSSYICEECAEYLFGVKSKYVVKILWLAFIMIGALLSLEFVWNLADTANGFMAIPNLIGILLLSNKVVQLKKEHFKTKKA